MSESQPSQTARTIPPFQDNPSLATEMTDRHRVVIQEVKQKYEESADWAVFFREALGVVERHYPTPNERARFQRTTHYAEIQRMLTTLREREGRRQQKQKQEQDETKVITVRMPQALHEYLKQEADLKNTSMNKLCISKLLQILDDRFLPMVAKELPEGE